VLDILDVDWVLDVLDVDGGARCTGCRLEYCREHFVQGAKFRTSSIRRPVSLRVKAAYRC